MCDTVPSVERSLEDVLIDDVILTGVSHPEVTRDVERRATVRAVFAAIEGMQSTLQSELLGAAGAALSSQEKDLLQEHAYTVTDSGQMRRHRARLTLEQRVKFTATLVQRLHPECSIDFAAGGWCSLMRSIGVRDRLTHPKTLMDLDVSNEEMSDALGGMLWFKWKLVDTLRGSVQAYQKTERTRLEIQKIFGIPTVSLMDFAVDPLS